MDWDDAKYFLAIAREGQMLGAARRMKVSQARLSRRLASLEDALGTRLFDRSTRGCTLTDDGKTFLSVAEGMESAVLSGVSLLRESNDGVQGTVRIGAPDGFGSAYLASRLGEIIDALPRLQLQLVPLPRNFSLSEREADVAIMIGRPTQGRLRSVKLTDYTLGLYASRDYVAVHDVPASSEDLRHHRLVGYVEDLVYTPELNYAAEFFHDWKSSVEISTAIGQLAAVRSGAGIGVLHDFMAIQTDDLVRVLPKARVTRSYFAVWHENLKGSRRVRAVVGEMERLTARDRRQLCLATNL
ncbi:MAG: LysR family transcriptional regulator [Pseudomonadota bacterium]